MSRPPMSDSLRRSRQAYVDSALLAGRSECPAVRLAQQLQPNMNVATILQCYAFIFDSVFYLPILFLSSTPLAPILHYD